MPKYYNKIFLLILSKILILFQYKINNHKLKLPFFHYINSYYFLNYLYGNPLRQIAKIKNLVIIDVGANIGDSLANLSGHGNEIHCFEPIKSYFKFLKINSNIIRNNSKSKVFLYNSIVSIRFSHLVKSNLSGSPIANNNNKLTNQIRFEISKFDNYKIDLIKTDTDGYDYDAIEKLFPVISRDLPMLYFELDDKKNSHINEYKRIIELLIKHGYHDFYIFSNFGNLIMIIDGNLLVNNLENFQDKQLKKCIRLEYIDIFTISKLSKNYETLKNNNFLNFNVDNPPCAKITDNNNKNDKLPGINNPD